MRTSGFSQIFQNTFNGARRAAGTATADVDLSEFASEAMALHDVSGRLITLSDNMYRLFGFDLNSLRGSGLTEQLHVQDRVAFLKAVSDVAHGGSVSPMECRLIGRGEAHSHVELRLNRLSNCRSGEIVTVFRAVNATGNAAGTNIEAEDRSAEALHGRERKLMTMSHELRTPLNAIIGFSEILYGDAGASLSEPKKHEYAGLIRDSSTHLLEIVNSMLAVLRLDEGKYTLSLGPVDPANIADFTIRMVGLEAEKKGVSLLSDLPADLPPLFGDDRACKQILLNLLSNAIKFTGAGGAVRLSAASDGQRVFIRVADSGIGMDETFVSQATRPFLQADEGVRQRNNGSGLGLSLVRGLVDLHQGTLEIDSEKGRGTTVTVSLPALITPSRPVPAEASTQIVNLSADGRSRSKNDLPLRENLPQSFTKASA